MYLKNRMNAIDVIYNKSPEVYPSCEKKSEVLEQDNLRCTYTMDMNLKLKLFEVPYSST